MNLINRFRDLDKSGGGATVSGVGAVFLAIQTSEAVFKLLKFYTLIGFPQFEGESLATTVHHTVISGILVRKQSFYGVGQIMIIYRKNRQKIVDLRHATSILAKNLDSTGK